MNRRRAVNIWPAFADLMTVVAVVALFATLSLLQSKVGLAGTITKQRTEIAKLKKELREAARNEKMFQAIQKAQTIVDDFTRNQGVEFSADQSLQFGNDLVSYELNSFEPQWKLDSRERLWDFCVALSSELDRDLPSVGPLRNVFTIQVEGHTDDTGCKGDPHCNWWISSSRAAVFVAFMKQDEYCPGGNQWKMLPVGFADTQGLPSSNGSRIPTRRMAIKLLPDYQAIIERQN